MSPDCESLTKVAVLRVEQKETPPDDEYLSKPSREPAQVMNQTLWRLVWKLCFHEMRLICPEMRDLYTYVLLLFLSYT